MTIESAILFNHLILCRPLFLLLNLSSMSLFQWLSSLHPVAKYWSFSISPFNKYSRLISFRIGWLTDWLSKGLSRVTPIKRMAVNDLICNIVEDLRFFLRSERTEKWFFHNTEGHLTFGKFTIQARTSPSISYKFCFAILIQDFYFLCVCVCVCVCIVRTFNLRQTL